MRIASRARTHYNIYMFSIDTTVYEYMRGLREKKNGVALIRGRRKMLFPRFFRQIDRVAGGLDALGIGKGDAVMLALPAIEQSVVAFYAVSRIGAVASMIHPKLSPAEFSKSVEEQKPKAVFVSDINLLKFAPLCLGARVIYCPFGMYAYFGLPRAKEFAPYRGDGSEPALYMRSGGTSGQPKTVVLSSRATNALASNLFETLGNRFGESDAMLATLPLFHGFGLVVGVHTVISTNAPTVLLPKFSGEAAAKAIARHKVTLLIAIPRMLKKLLATPSFSADAVSSLKEVYVGGDLVDSRLESEFNARMEEGGATARLSPGYGLTETGSVCVLRRPPHRENSVGRPLCNIGCRIVDERLKELPDGEAGELLLCGNQLMEGYLGDAEATERALTEIDGVKWLRTGDIFRKDSECNLFFMGRLKRLIKISGINVFPSELERVARQLPFVSECAAVETVADGKTYVKLFVEGVLSSEQKTKLKSHICANLSHWYEPKFIICTDALPRTDIGKIDFVRLQNEY